MSSYWQDKTVLVTGAGGFIGSHLVERLYSEGARVRAFVRYTSRADNGLLNQLPDEVREKILVVAGDIRDESAISSAVDGVEIVFHLGALISIPYSYVHPREVIESNLLGTLNLLMACRQGRVARMIHTSTSEVYGTAQYAPIDESHPLQGQSPYSASKIGADKLVESFYCSYDLPVVTVRPFNTYGPRQSARAIIPTIITQALAGNELKLGNLDVTRDFTFVEDTVNGFIHAAQTENISGQTFNLGTGAEISIRHLVEVIEKVIGVKTQIVHDPVRMRPERSEVMRLISDNSLAREKLAWSPRVSLEDGLARTVAWIHDHLELYKIGKYVF